jgi:hypothetical protein
MQMPGRNISFRMVRFSGTTFKTLAAIDLLLRDARSYGDTTALSFEASSRSISILAR